MRFMIIVKASKDSEAGVLPGKEILEAMGKYNEELVKAGVLLDAAGLHPTSKGARVKFDGPRRTVTDGPFSEAKELIAGFWLFQCKSRDEAIEWVKRAPMLPGDELEIRQVFDVGEFPEASDELKQKYRAMDAELQARR